MFPTPPDQVNCNNCAALCCIGIARTGSRFDHESTTSGVRCKQLCDNCKCRIHETLKERSPACLDYTCNGVGELITKIFGLDLGKICTNPLIHAAFQTVQGIVRILYRFKKIQEGNIKNDLLDKEIQKLERLLNELVYIDRNQAKDKIVEMDMLFTTRFFRWSQFLYKKGDE